MKKPNLVISSQFAQYDYTLKNGTSISGIIGKKTKDKIYLVTSGFAQEMLSMIRTNEIKSKKISNISMMPPALINTMNEEELKDLMAYLISGGDKDNKVYK